MRGSFSKIVFMLVIFIVVFSISICFDWGHNEWGWFSKSGSLILLSGLLSALIEPKVFSKKNGGPINKLKDQDFIEKYNKDEGLNPLVKIFENCCMILGTLMWAFGDTLKLYTVLVSLGLLFIFVYIFKTNLKGE